MREPGIYHDLPEDEYHGDEGSISVSGMKLLLKAPALFRHEQENPAFKDAWDLGTVTHKMILGSGPTIDIVEANDWRTKAAQEAKKAAREAGRVALLRKDHERAERMANAVLDHHIASQLLTGGQAEVSAFREDEETGICLRARFDYVIPGALVDVKTAANADPRALPRVVAERGYDMQDAHYRETGAKCGLDAGTFAFVFVEKDPPHLVTVCQLDGAFIARGQRRVRAAIERYRDCAAADQWPGYITNFTTLTPPRWVDDNTEVLDE